MKIDIERTKRRAPLRIVIAIAVTTFGVIIADSLPGDSIFSLWLAAAIASVAVLTTLYLLATAFVLLRDQ